MNEMSAQGKMKTEIHQWKFYTFCQISSFYPPKLFEYLRKLASLSLTLPLAEILGRKIASGGLGLSSGKI